MICGDVMANIVRASTSISGDVVAGIVQAIATIIAVIVGFRLSALNERSIRSKIDSDAHRDRQLDAIIDLLDALNVIRDASQMVLTRTAPYQVPGQDTATGQLSRQSELGVVQRQLLDDVLSARAAAQRINRISILLSLLGLNDVIVAGGDEAKLLADRCLVSMDDAFAATANGHASLQSEIARLDALITSLLESGRLL